MRCSVWLPQIAAWVFLLDTFFSYNFSKRVHARVHCVHWLRVFDFGAYLIYWIHTIWALRPWYLNGIEWLLFGIRLSRNRRWSPPSKFEIITIEFSKNNNSFEKTHFVRSLKKFRSNLSDERSQLFHGNYVVQNDNCLQFAMRILYSVLSLVLRIELLNFSIFFSLQVSLPSVDAIYFCLSERMSRIRIWFIIWNVTYLWIIINKKNR